MLWPLSKVRTQTQMPAGPRQEPGVSDKGLGSQGGVESALLEVPFSESKQSLHLNTENVKKMVVLAWSCCNKYHKLRGGGVRGEGA